MNQTKKDRFPSPTIKSSNTVLVALIRQVDGIIALLADERDAGIESTLRRVSLPDLDCTVFALARGLQADWQTLRNARDLKTAWPAFWRVFWCSIPDIASTGVALATPQRAPAKRPVATAAHPRAFRGTKFQPPKPAQAELDLCALLLEQRLLDGFFACHDFNILPALDQHGLPLLHCKMRTTAGFLAHAWQVTEQDLPAFPVEFRRYFLWHLRHQPYTLMLDWLTLWRALEWDGSSEKQCLLARLCAVAAQQFSWANLLMQLRPARHLAYLRALLKRRCYLHAPSLFSAEQMQRLDALTENDERFALYVDIVLDNLGRQVSAAYSLHGCKIAEMRDSIERDERRLRTSFDANEVPIDIIMHASDLAGGGIAVTLWQFCGELPGFAGFLRDICWGALSNQTADTLINLSYHFFSYEDEKIRLLDNWRVYLKVFPVFHAILITLQADWQEKMAGMWKHFIDGWDDFARLESALQDVLPLMVRLCRPPFSATADYSYTLINIIEPLSPAHRAQLPDLDLRIWLSLERACRRQDDTALLVYGFCIFSTAAPAIAFEAMQLATDRLWHSVQLLGCLSYERRRQFMAGQLKTDWFTLDWQGMQVEEACRLLLRMSSEAGLDSPLPRRLRAYFEGSEHLSAVQITRHCKLALSRLPAVRLQAFENAIWKTIDAPFQLRGYSAAARHALRLLAGLDSQTDSNRKGLRKFLKQAGKGQALSYLDHPLNQAWYAAHPRVAASLWSTGLRHTVQLGNDELTLAFEDDPFEILMLGSYVGSCLGAGGLCSYSAVACLLDANKQVLYARNAKGKVVARQLLAIDEAEQLVCFSVYPQSVHENLLAAFKAYDLAMAESLGLRLYLGNEDDSYDIPTVLALGWWDDGVWSKQ